MYECDDKMVSHPSHYQLANGLEVIDVIEAFTADLKGIEATDTGNVLKYMGRWKQKNGLQDLKKARWYLEHLIERVEHNGGRDTPTKAIEELKMQAAQLQWQQDLDNAIKNYITKKEND